MENNDDKLLMIPLVCKENSDARLYKVIKWLMVVLALCNLIWAAIFSIYVFAPTESSQVTLESQDDGNANYIDGEGDIINGKDSHNEN